MALRPRDPAGAAIEIVIRGCQFRLRYTIIVLIASCGAPQAPAEPAPAPSACPGEHEDVDGFEDDDGCPDPDNDRDGVPDVDDACPCHAEDVDAFEDADGCPEPDNDQDHVVDACDLCPNEAEVYNGVEDLDGCPDQALVRITQNRIVVIEHIYFDKDSARIQDVSLPILDAVAAVMRDYPQLTSVEVQGHASRQERRPTELAQRRAEAVRDALVQRGVEPARLVARGYGLDRPIDTNDTATGRARNRRADFRILAMDAPAPAGPPPAPNTPCPDGPPPSPPPVCGS
jgi:outer membrane protein OmpA-like peptidoglycan-associated protein